MNKVKETLKKAGVSDEVLASSDPDKLFAAIEELKAPQEQVQEAISQEDYDLALAQLAKFKEDQLKMAKKIFNVDEKTLRVGETEEKAVERKIREKGEYESDYQIDVGDELQMEVEQFIQDQGDYKEIKQEIGVIAKNVLGVDTPTRNGREVKKALENIKSQLAKSPNPTISTQVADFESRYNELNNKVNEYANTFAVEAGDTNSRLSAIVSLAQKAKGLETQLASVERNLEIKTEELETAKGSVNATAIGTNDLTRENTELKQKAVGLQKKIDQFVEELKSKKQEIQRLTEAQVDASKLMTTEAHDQAIAELKNQYKFDLETELTKERNERAKREAELLLTFDRQILRQDPLEQQSQLLKGYVLNNPDDGISLEASKGWGSAFFGLGKTDQNLKLKEACDSIKAQMYLSAQNDLQKQAILELKGVTSTRGEGFELKTLTPLTDKLKYSGSEDLSELNQLYKEIKKGFQNTNEEIEFKQLLENVRGRKPKSELGASQLSELVTERNKVFEQLAEVERSHQALKLRQQALDAVGIPLLDAYTKSHQVLLESIDLNDPNDIRFFDKKSLEMTRNLAQEISSITENLLNTERFNKTVEQASEFEKEGYLFKNAGTNRYEFNTAGEGGLSQEQIEEFKGFDFLRELTGMSKDRIAEIFPSVFVGPQKKKVNSPPSAVISPDSITPVTVKPETPITITPVSPVTSEPIEQKITPPSATIPPVEQNVEELRAKASKVTMGDQDNAEKLVQLALSGNDYAQEVLDQGAISLNDIATDQSLLNGEIDVSQSYYQRFQDSLKKEMNSTEFFDNVLKRANEKGGNTYLAVREEMEKELEIKRRQERGINETEKRIKEQEKTLKEIESVRLLAPPSKANEYYFSNLAQKEVAAIEEGIIKGTTFDPKEKSTIHFSTRRKIAKEMNEVLNKVGNELRTPLDFNEKYDRYATELENSGLPDDEQSEKLSDFINQNDPVAKAVSDLHDRWHEQLKEHPDRDWVTDQINNMGDGLGQLSLLFNRRDRLKMKNSINTETPSTIAPPPQQKAPDVWDQKKQLLREKQKAEAMSPEDFLSRESPHVEFYYDGEKRSMEYETTPSSFYRGSLKEEEGRKLFNQASQSVYDNSSTKSGLVKVNGRFYKISPESSKAKLVTKDEAQQFLGANANTPSPVTTNPIEQKTTPPIAPKPVNNLIDEDEAIALGYIPAEIKMLNQFLSGEKKPQDRFEEKEAKSAEQVKALIETKRKSKNSFEFIQGIQSQPYLHSVATQALTKEAEVLSSNRQKTTFTIKGFSQRQPTGLEAARGIKPEQTPLDIANQEGFSYGNDVVLGLGANVGSIYLGGFNLGRYEPSVANKIATLLGTNKNLGKRIAQKLNKKEPISQGDRAFIEFILRHLAPSKIFPSNWKSDSYYQGWNDVKSLFC